MMGFGLFGLDNINIHADRQVFPTVTREERVFKDESLDFSEIWSRTARKTSLLTRLISIFL